MKRELFHDCDLSEDHGGLPKLPPNAPFRARFIRFFRKLLSPNPNAKICKRSYRNQSQINAERRRYAANKYVYIIHPYSDMEFYRELMFVFIALWEIVSNPFVASFGCVWRQQEELGHERALTFNENYYQYPNFLILTSEVFWIITCFFTGYKEKHYKTIELNKWKIIKRYLLTYFFIDLMFLTPPVKDATYQSLIYWVNLISLFRTSTLVAFIRRFLLDMGVKEQPITIINIICLSFFFVHVFACIFYVLPFQYNSSLEELWVVKTKLHPNEKLSKVYFGCFSIIQTHFWGLGEAQKRVRNVWESLILTIVMITGRLWSLFILATMLRIFTISSLSESKYEEYLLQLKTFIAQKEIPQELADRLLEYYQYKYQHHYFNEKAIFNALSHYLKKELLLYGARNVITKVALFKFFPRSIIGSIIAKCKVMVYLNNDVVINMGDTIENIYFISNGTLAVFNSQGIEIAHLSDGDDLGTKGLTTTADTYFNYTYTAIETTELYVISLKDFRAILYNKNDILKYFARRIEERLQEMRKIEDVASTHEVDFLSELHGGKILERPRIRTRYFER